MVLECPIKNMILELTQYLKSSKVQCLIYAERETLIKKIGGIIQKKSSTTNVDEHIPCGYSMSTI